MTSLGAWVALAIFLNYLLYAITGYPVLWITLCQAAKPLSFYVTVTNLALAVGIIGGGIWYGPLAAIKMAVVLVGFNLVPAVLAALMAFGHRCA